MNTPARLDRDSRSSSVSIALPAASDISCATLSTPASRLAPTGSRRKCVRSTGSDEQPLEEAGGGLGLGSRHLRPPGCALRSRMGPPSTAITGMNNATHTAPRAAQTTGSGASCASCCS